MQFWVVRCVHFHWKLRVKLIRPATNKHSHKHSTSRAPRKMHTHWMGTARTRPSSSIKHPKTHAKRPPQAWTQNSWPYDYWCDLRQRRRHGLLLAWLYFWFDFIYACYGDVCCCTSAHLLRARCVVRLCDACVLQCIYGWAGAVAFSVEKQFGVTRCAMWKCNIIHSAVACEIYLLYIYVYIFYLKTFKWLLKKKKYYVHCKLVWCEMLKRSLGFKNAAYNSTI